MPRNLMLACPVFGADFNSSIMEYRRANTELSLKYGTVYGNLVLHLKNNTADLPIGSLTCRDTSQFANHGTQNLSFAAGNVVTGKIGQAYYNGNGGTSQRVSVPAIDAYKVTTQFTVCAWIRNFNWVSQYILGHGASISGNHSWYIGHLSGGQVQLFVSANGLAFSSITTSSVQMTTGFKHFVFRYNAGVATIKVNNVNVGFTGSLPSSVQASNISSFMMGSSSSAGYYDDIRLYNRALSDDEIATIYNSGTGTELQGDAFPTSADCTFSQIDAGFAGSTWDMSAMLTVENPSAESGTIRYKYAVSESPITDTYASNPSAYSADWLTLAQFQALPDVTGRYIRIAQQLGGTGTQDATTGSFAIGVVANGEPPVSPSDLRYGIDRGDGVFGEIVIPDVNDVREGANYDITKVGTIQLPGTSLVLVGTPYGSNGTEFSGSYMPDYPADSDVRLGTVYAEGQHTGTVVIPNADNVLNDIEVDHTVGNFVYPPEENIEKKFKYGANGTQFTGSLKGVGILLLRKIGEDFMSDIAVEKHYVGEIGTKIVINTGKDLTEATVTKIRIERPDGTILDKTGAITTIGGLPHFIAYTTIAEDFNVSGQYKIQPYVELPTFSGYGATACFKVYEVWK